MKRVVAYLNRCCIGLHLLAGLFLMVSTAMAQDAMPDLTPVVVNANQGVLEIRNNGNVAAKPSQLFVVCSRFGSGKPSTFCAAGLHLPNYIKKWNTLSYDIPALPPGARHRIHLFGAGALPRKAGNYGMKISVDPLRHIAESNENNNYTRLDTTIKAEKAGTSKSAERKPDLMPVIVNADQGIVQVKNIGRATAKASKLAAQCRIYDSRDVFVRFCTARTYLPNFDAMRLLLNYRIPPLKPGESHEIHLFGPHAWPSNTGRYHLKVYVDQGGDVEESGEGNNSTEFTSLYVSHDLTSGSKTANNMADLIAVASDPFFGIAYVENKGDTDAKASKLLMTCDQVGQKGGCPTNPAMERIYDFTLGGYVIDVPALPAGKVQRILFPMTNLKWDKGQYTFSLTADAGRAVTETSESNNTARKTFRWGTGVLRIVSPENGKPVLISYGVYPAGDRKHIFSWRNKNRAAGSKIQTPVDISLPTGVYQLSVYPANSQGAAQWFRVTVKASKVITQKVSFQQPGLLELDIAGEHGEKLARVTYRIKVSGKKTVVAGYDGSLEGSPFRVSLLPGNYDLYVYRKLSHFKASGTSTADSSPVMGADEEQIVRGIRIQSDQTIKKKFVFKYIEPGFLSIRVFSDGKPNQAHASVFLNKKDAPFLFYFNASRKIRLVPGRYRLLVTPKDEKINGAFQNAGYGSKSVEVTINAGETVEKHVNFVKARKGSLALTVLVNGSRNEAKTGIRTAGRKGRFITIDISKTDLLPGRYDVSVWPVEHCLSPGGVDVFHGGVSGPGFRTRRLPDVKPVILYDIGIKSGERLKKTVEFKGVTRYTKVCM